jgi:hypothetical protein
MKMYGTVEVQFQAFEYLGSGQVNGPPAYALGKNQYSLGRRFNRYQCQSESCGEERTFCSCWELNPDFLVILPVA